MPPVTQLRRVTSAPASTSLFKHAARPCSAHNNTTRITSENHDSTLRRVCQQEKSQEYQVGASLPMMRIGQALRSFNK
eukprot:1322737-Rhodomonas_salina.3